MVTIGMNYSVLPGKEDVFEGACRKVIEVMGEAGGHAESHLYRRLGDEAGAHYLIVSRWDDEYADFGSMRQPSRVAQPTTWS